MDSDGNDNRLKKLVEEITNTLLQVGAGNLNVHVERDFRGDELDIMAFLVDTTISELRVLEDENKKRNAEELEKIIRRMKANELRLNHSVDEITEVLLQVGQGKLDVRVERDFQGDAIDIMAFLVDTTISELRFLEEEKRVINANIQARLEAEVAERTRELQLVNIQLKNDMAEIESLHKKLSEQAVRNPLTNLYNRRYLQDVLDREIQRSLRAQSPLSIIAIDLDHFKQVNDQFGHDGGDYVLKSLSELLASQMRGADFACRSGGEEFILALPGATCAIAMRRARQIRKKFEGLLLEYHGVTMQNTFSAGVACFPDHGKTSIEVLLHADAALYAAKNAGRNRVVGWRAPAAISSLA